MALFEKCGVFYSETKCCLTFCVEKIACRYYMKLSVVAQSISLLSDFQNKSYKKVYFELLKLFW